MAAFPGDTLGMEFVRDLDRLSPEEQEVVDQMVAEMAAELAADDEQATAC